MVLPSRAASFFVFKTSLHFLVAQESNSIRFFTHILALPLFGGCGILLLFLGCFSPFSACTHALWYLLYSLLKIFCYGMPVTWHACTCLARVRATQNPVSALNSNTSSLPPLQCDHFVTSFFLSPMVSFLLKDSSSTFSLLVLACLYQRYLYFTCKRRF